VSYSVFFLPRADREFAALSKSDFERVKRAIDGLADNPRPTNSQKLKGRGGWRIRAGDYRVVYDIDNSVRTVMIANIGHRREVYP
jgi:mRNA interferase RelE/StbE